MLHVQMLDGQANIIRLQYPDEFTAKIEIVRDGNTSFMNQIIRNEDGHQVLSVPAGLVLSLYRG